MVICTVIDVRLFGGLPQGSTDLEHIQIIKKAGGKLTDSYLDEGIVDYLYNPLRLLLIGIRLHPG